MASIAHIIASVAPQVTVISRSGSRSSPEMRLFLSAIARRSRGDPQVMAYWLMSALMQSIAACLMKSGAGKSG